MRSAALLLLSTLLASLVLAAPAAGHHMEPADTPLGARWHVTVLAYLPGVELMLLVESASLQEAKAALGRGETPPPTSAHDARIDPAGVEPGARAALDAAPTEAARRVAFAERVLAADELTALADALRGDDPARAATVGAAAALDRVLTEGRGAQDYGYMCLLLCLSSGGDRCPAGGLPP